MERAVTARRSLLQIAACLVVALLVACTAALDSTPSPTASPTHAEAMPTHPPVTPSLAAAKPTTSTTGLPRASPPPGFPAQPADVPWPTQEWAEAEWPAGVDRDAVDRATERSLADGDAERVRALVVVHRGAIVYERYSPNDADGPNVTMPSYSIAKSVTSAFIGILVRDGLIDVNDPAPVPEWHEDPSDPRADITVEHMLHMATGMEWNDNFSLGSDIFRIVASSDAAEYAAAQEPSHPPGEHFDYNTGTSVLLARIVGDATGADRPGDVRDFMERELFDTIGMEPVRTDFDEAGTWLGGWSADSTARSFAKFGLLYVRGGHWDGVQLLPAEWIEYTGTPSPANPAYGAHWWLDPQRPGVLYALGLNGQVITVDPVHDLVIVQLSTVGGDLPLQQTEAILDAFYAAR